MSEFGVKQAALAKSLIIVPKRMLLSLLQWATQFGWAAAECIIFSQQSSSACSSPADRGAAYGAIRVFAEFGSAPWTGLCLFFAAFRMALALILGAAW